jgi:hypothetical protein
MLEIITSNPNLYMEYVSCSFMFVNLWMQVSSGRMRAVNRTSECEKVITRHGIRGIVTRSPFPFFLHMNFGMFRVL